MLKKIILGRRWPLYIILLTAGLILSYNLGKPFWGHHDWNGVYWGNVSRNYLRYGLFTTKLASIDNFGLTNPSGFSYSFHYSPLFPLSQAIFLFIFGVHEWALRLMAGLFSLGTIAVFYELVKKNFSQRIAFVSALFWIFTPMSIYFGKMPVHEPEVLFFSILAIYLYLTNRFRWLLVCVVLAELTTWPGYFIVPAITLHWLISRGSKLAIKKILSLWFVSFAVFGTLLLHDYLVTGSFFGGGLAEIFFFRVHSVALIRYVSTLVRWRLTYYSPILLGLLLVALVCWRNIKYMGIPFLFFVFAIIYPVIFRDASFRHDYLLIYFLPFVSLGAALGLSQIISEKKKLYLVCSVMGVILMLILRWKFIFALERSDIYRESVVFGKYINIHSQPLDKILAVTADPSVGFDSIFIGFYADRQLSISRSLPATTSGYTKIFVYPSGGKIESVIYYDHD